MYARRSSHCTERAGGSADAALPAAAAPLRDRFSKHQDKRLHENDFIMASKIDRMADRPGPTPTGTPP